MDYGDLPREALMAEAQRAINNNPPGTFVHFKYTCAGCGTRCTLAEPNMLRASGECHVCGHVTLIERGGFLLVVRTSPED